VLSCKSTQTIITADATWHRAANLIAELPTRAWRSYSTRAGAHGERISEWARISIRVAWKPGLGYWLLARRSISSGELAHYMCYGPRSTSLADLTRVAGSRWRIEECFQQAKNEAGLDHYQVWDYRAWYAHITLSMLTLAWLSATRATLAGIPEKGVSSRSKPPEPKRCERVDRLHGTRGAPSADQTCADRRTECRSCLVVVDLAETTSAPGTSLPLPAPWTHPTISAVAVVRGGLDHGSRQSQRGGKPGRAFHPLRHAAAVGGRQVRDHRRGEDAGGHHGFTCSPRPQHHLDHSITWDQGAEMARTRSSPSLSISRSTSATRTHPGSGAATRTRTGCCVSTCPRALTSAASPGKNCSQSRTSLTVVPARLCSS
jgi:hypothetical protein